MKVNGILIAACMASAATSPLWAKAPKFSTVEAGYKACFAEATKHHTVSKDGDYVQFRCDSDVAEPLYELLGSQGSPTQSQTLEDGTYMVRPTNSKIGNGQDFCGQHTQEADLSPATGYTCVLHAKAGTFP
jgi:hypothetical protein